MNDLPSLASNIILIQHSITMLLRDILPLFNYIRSSNTTMEWSSGLDEWIRATRAGFAF